MFERYESDKLFVATIRNLYLNKESNQKTGKGVYHITKRKGIIYDKDNTMVDITRPDDDLDEMTCQHQVQILDMEPLYPEGIHKIVSKRQAYKQYINNKKRKLTI